MLEQVQTLTAFPAETWTHIKALGRGGQSETALYQHALTGELAAIKRLHARHAADLKQLELFFREGDVLRTLAHPGIPRVLDVFVVRADGGPAELYIAQSFFEGQNLSDHLASSTRPAPAQLKVWLEDLLEIMSYIHTRLPPVFHRDIKPSNIIITPAGRAMLIDFGAVATGWARSDASTVVGTHGYTAPEQYSGVVGPRTDLYSLGAVAWEVVTGRIPSVDENTGRLLIPSGLDSGLTRFIRATTSTIPNERPGSAEEARELLLTAVARPVKSGSAGRGQTRRRKRGANSIDSLFPAAPELSDEDSNTFDEDDEEVGALDYEEPIVTRPVPAPLPFELPALPPAPRPIDGEFQELFIEMVSLEKHDSLLKYFSMTLLVGVAILTVFAFQTEREILLDLLPFAIIAALIGAGAWFNQYSNFIEKRTKDPSVTVAGRLFVNGTMAKAKVLSCEPIGTIRRKTEVTVSYTFATPKESNLSGQGQVPAGFAQHCQPGATIGVVYDPEMHSSHCILPWY